MPCVLQEWVCGLTYMQQTVLMTATRAPDGLRKDHPVKVILRWYRRCILLSAFDGAVLGTPHVSGGGSFTGPFTHRHADAMGIASNTSLPHRFDEVRKVYLRHVDEMPHHFQLHMMHGAQILGYKHPNVQHRRWWNEFYLMIVNDAHLFPESEVLMDMRLGDSERQWRAREEVTAV